MPMNNQATQPNKEKFFIINKVNESIGEILVYGDISSIRWWENDVSANSFAIELEKIKNCSEIKLRVHTDGGDVFEAMAMYNKLSSLAADSNVTITSYVDGIAASAGSFLIQSGSKRIIGKGGMVMVHNPATRVSGDASVLDKTKKILAQVKESILDIYVSKNTKLTRDQISEMMDKETFMTAQEALDNGFVDEIEDYKNDTVSNNLKNFMNSNRISNYQNSENMIVAIHNSIKLLNEKNQNKEEIKEMPKNLMELKNLHPGLLDEYKKEVLNSVDNTEVINNATLAERERIKNLDSIKVYNDTQREVINNAKFVEPRDHRDIVMEFYNSNAFLAGQEIAQVENEKDSAGINNISASEDPKSQKELEEEDIIKNALDGFGEVK